MGKQQSSMEDLGDENGKNMIEGVVIKPLVKIPDERGCIFPMLRSDSPEFTGFGEIRFSYLFPGKINAWTLYKQAYSNFSVVDGMMKLVLFDNREMSKTRGDVQELFLGDMKYCLVQIPCGVWHGYKGITYPHSLIAYCTDKPLVSSEIEKVEASSDQIPYQWGVKHG